MLSWTPLWGNPKHHGALIDQAEALKPEKAL